MVEFELAKDKIMMGAERRSMVMSEEWKSQRLTTKAGHAIVGRLPEHDQCAKYQSSLVVVHLVWLCICKSKMA